MIKLNRIIKLFAILITILIATINVFAAGPYAYPVPFNPKNGTVKYLTIKYNSEPAGIDNINIKIFDINGDLVIAKSYTGSFGAGKVWNGRNSSGTLVKPGLYFIRVVYENSDSDVYGKKVIRILVQY